MRKFSVIGLLAAFVLLVVTGMSDAVVKKEKVGNCPTKSEISLRMGMRALWEDHIAWTRDYIVSAVNGLEGTDKIAARLLKNQEDIGNAIKPYYGDAAGDKLTALLKDHILIAAELVSAAKAGDNAKAADAEKRWYSNGDEIAAFLSGANPNWSKESLKEMLDAHLSLTKAVAVASITKDFDSEIAASDKNKEHMLMMADALSAGIVKQFPEKFKETEVACK